jgi:hypothetical protein
MITNDPHTTAMNSLINQTSMDPVTKLFHRWIALTMKNNRLIIIRNLTLGLGINPHHIALAPNLFHQLLNVPRMLR